MREELSSSFEPTSQQIKLAILKWLKNQYNGDDKYNIIGRADAPVGAIENSLGGRFNADQRHLASKCFDELRTADLIRSTHGGGLRPEDWVEITDAGIEALEGGSVDELKTVANDEHLLRLKLLFIAADGSEQKALVLTEVLKIEDLSEADTWKEADYMKGEGWVQILSDNGPPLVRLTHEGVKKAMDTPIFSENEIVSSAKIKRLTTLESGLSEPDKTGDMLPKHGVDVAAKYIFLDIVGFTRNRKAEPQADIVKQLNKIVSEAAKSQSISEDRIIFIPTGDGICIVLLGVEHPVDVHVLIALDILERIDTYNASTQDTTRQFQVRIGINANPDILVIDINNRQNIAGAGISTASRIMGLADGGQIIVGQAVYVALQSREKYDSAFRSYRATVKHGEVLDVYQFVAEGPKGLNTDEPQSQKRAEPEPNLSMPEQRQSIYKTPPQRWRKAVPGHWVGEVDQKLGPGGPIKFKIEFHLKIDGIRVLGDASFEWEDSTIKLQIVDGGFIDGPYVKLDYEDVDPTIFRCGTMFFRLFSLPKSKKLAGWFVGCAAEVDGLIYGEITISKESGDLEPSGRAT